MELAAMLLPLLCLVTVLPGHSRAGNVGFTLRSEPIGAEEAEASGAAGAKAARVLDEPGPGRRPRMRKPKLISFTTDSSQIGVELGFTVPLLKVPLQGARTGVADGLEGPGTPGPLFKQPISVNVGALFVAGSMLLTVMGIVPSIYQAFSKSARPHGLHARSVGVEAEDEQVSLWAEAGSPWGSLLHRADKALARRGLDARLCGGRALCMALAGAAARVRRGAAGSMDLVLHGVARSPWVSQWVTGTELQDAASGAEGPDHCSRRFAHCQLPVEFISLLGLGAGSVGPDRASNDVGD